MQIPGIDLHACCRATDEALGAGLRDFGFVAVRGHGVPEGLLEDARRVAREFFALSEARKRALVVPGGAGQRGYTPLAVETARDQTRPDLKEFFHVGREPGPASA